MKTKIPFTFDDWGWVVLSVGMGIGAGIAFAPVPVGMCGVWVFLIVALVGYPGIFLFQRLFIDVLGQSDEPLEYTELIAREMGKWGSGLIGTLYFLMLFIWFFVYAEAIVNDSASYLVTFKVTTSDLSSDFFYATGVIAALTVVAATGEKLLFKLGSVLSLSVVGVIILLGVVMLPDWSWMNVSPLPHAGTFAREGLWLLPFVLTSILFLQSLSPMVVWFRENSSSSDVAVQRASRAHNVAFVILFSAVFFYVLSFAFSMTQSEAVTAYRDNVSALALVVRRDKGTFLRVLGLLLEILAIVTSFFSVYVSLRASLSVKARRIFANLGWKRLGRPRAIDAVIAMVLIILAVTIVLVDFPILTFTVICGPIFGVVGCLTPAWIVLRKPALRRFRNVRLAYVVCVGVMLCLAPFAASLVRARVDKPTKNGIIEERSRGVKSVEKKKISKNFADSGG